MNIVIPMAGLGTRFSNEGFDLPKPLIEVGGKTLIEHSINSLNLEGKYIFITRKYENENHNILLSEILKKIKPDSVEIIIEEITSGSVETCLMSSDYINNETPLIITNCDQRLEWDSDIFLEFIKNEDLDGALLTYESDNPKNSFCSINSNNLIDRVVEKQIISKTALVGLHYWSKGLDFVSSAKQLFKSFKNDGKPECYISETFNFLIKEGKKIKPFEISPNEYISLGTPYDLSIFQSKIKEFYTEKPKTIFCDIDGTILHHVHKFSDVCFIEPKLLDGVRNKFNEWDSQGHKIVLCTARKESGREITEKHLKQLGLCWDYLIMGVSGGVRVLINDKLNKMDENRAVSINVITNEGFEKIDWKKYKL
jgi:NDP-sugar pyrophosphorylase family protein